jgi:ethanolamine ammonia-lyase small subunit
MVNDDRVNGSFLSLKKYTDARLAIGRTGTSIPVKESLAFNLAHAHARDAVYSALETERLINELRQFNLPVILVQSKAKNREQYLQRPDLGRQLNDHANAEFLPFQPSDICIVIADGLSADAINKHAVKVLELLIPKINAINLKIAPITLIEQGRVAIADEAGYRLKAKLSLILIGERPGLSAADSMGAYLTFDPKPGLTDESRNCVSNIRPEGLNLDAAADKLFYLIREALRMKLSGIGLKDQAGLLD